MEFIKIKSKDPFVLKEIEQYHPDSPRHTKYWKELKKLALEGCWGEDFNNEFRFMPPKLWYYINFGLIQDEDKKTKARKEIRPKLADVMWELSYACLEARGFSGFKLDQNRTADKELLKFSKSSTPVSNIDQSLYFKPGGAFKDYINPRELLRSRHKEQFGCPLYNNPASNLMILGARGGGKATTYNSEVYNLHGKTTIGALNIGDQIYGSDGNLATVTGLYPQGVTKVYRVKLADGRFLDTHLDHQWKVKTQGDLKTDRIITTKDLLNQHKYKHKKSGYTYKYFVEQCKPVQYQQQVLPIDPYILGCMLGDGTMTTVTPKLASSDLEIINYFKTNLELGYKVQHDTSTTNNHTLSYFGTKKRLVGSGRGRHMHSYNPLHDEIVKLGVNKNCKNKFIPPLYLTASIEQRLALLQGLMDTDGSVNKEGACEFTNTNKQLINDVASLCRSLGIRCKLGEDTRGGQEHNIKGHKCKRNNYWRLFINTSQPIFKLSRKLNQLKQTITTKEQFVAIVDVEERPEEETICLTINNQDHCYLTNDYLVTHNSYYIAGELLHEVLFDGTKEYTQDSINNPTKVEVFLGSAIASKSTETSQKILASHNALALKKEFGAWGELSDYDYEPSPFYKDMTGDIGPNNMKSPWRHEYEEKVNGRWLTGGTKSVLKHNIFTTENPQAAAGGRYTLMFTEEVGLCPNVIVSHWSNEACMRVGTRKFGSAIYAGTAGDMEKIIESQEMFENPREYNMLAYPNDWENIPSKEIGFFLPAYYTDFDFKDKEGNTDVQVAKTHYEELHAKQRKAKNAAAYEGELMNTPIIPAHMFIKKTGNLLPVAEIDEQLRHLEYTEIYKRYETPVKLVFDKNETTGIKYIPDTKGELKPLVDFPLSSNEHNREGCVVIYEFPKYDPETDRPYEGMYIIGHDPIKEDNEFGQSLASIYVLKTNKYKFNHGHNEIVASYIGRPYGGQEEINETLEKLAMFYGATPRMIWFERNVGETKAYFEKKQKLNLLALKPQLVFADTHKGKTGPRLIYGYTISNQHDKLDAVNYLRTWLLKPHTEHSDGKVELNLHRIQDRGLLKEMKMFNTEGNFDRCFLPNTKILTQNGFESIENLQENTLVSTLTGQYPIVVTHKTNYNDIISEIKVLGQYNTIKCTKNHPIYTCKPNYKTSGYRVKKRYELTTPEYKEANQLIPNDYLLVPKRKKLEQNNLTESELYLLGWYLADGYIQKNKLKIRFGLNEKIQAENIVTILNNMDSTTINGRHLAKVVKDKYSNCYNVSRTSDIICNFILKYCGGTNDKHIKPELFNKSGLLKLVQGYFEGDGFQHFKFSYDTSVRTTLSATTIYENLAKQLRQILIDNSIWCTIRKPKIRPNSQQQYCIEISDPEMQDKLAYGSTKFKLTNQTSTKKFAIEKNEGFWTPIKRITTTNYNGTTYNLSILNDNTYIAEGLLVHNCMGFIGCIIGLEETYNQFKDLSTKRESPITDTINFFKQGSKRLAGDYSHEFSTTKTKNSIQQKEQTLEETKYRLPMFPS